MTNAKTPLRAASAPAPTLADKIADAFSRVAFVATTVFGIRRWRDNRVLARIDAVNRVHGTQFPTTRKDDFQHCVHYRTLAKGCVFFDMASGKMALVRSYDDIEVVPITDILAVAALPYGENGARYVLRITVHNLCRPIFDLEMGSEWHLNNWSTGVLMLLRKASLEQADSAV